MTILWLSFAHAGLIDAMDEPARHVATCTLAAEEAESAEDWPRAAGVWRACRDEADRRGFSELREPLSAQAAVGDALAVAADFRDADPHRWAQAVLTEAAHWSNVRLLTNVVPRVFRRWMETDEGRGFMENHRSVSVDWEGKSVPADVDVFRRYVEDAGLQWVSPGSPDADVIVGARLSRKVSDGAATAQGTLAAADDTLTITKIRLRKQARSLKGFSVSAGAESPEPADAAQAALREVSAAAAQLLLQRVVADAFAGREPEAP